jgi:hypothetical protein
VDERNWIRDSSELTKTDYDLIESGEVKQSLWVLYNNNINKVLDSESSIPLSDDRENLNAEDNESNVEQVLILRGIVQIHLYAVGFRETRRTKLMISNQTKNCSNIYNLEFDEWEEKIMLSKDTLKPFKNDPLDTGELKGVVYAQGEEYKKTKGYICRVTSEGIAIYDKDLKFKRMVKNTNIQQILHIDDWYMYCLSNASKKPMMN